MNKNSYKKMTFIKQFLIWLFVVISCLFLIISSFETQASSCEVLFYTDTGASGSRPYKAYYTDSLETASTCFNQTGGNVVSTSTEFALLEQAADSTNLDAIKDTLVGLFEFSKADFALFNGICLVGFISGHSIGRVARLLGKT